MAEQISIRGAFDLHIHSTPSLFPRIADDRTVVEEARKAGMAGVMLKCHHQSTVERAQILQDEYPDIGVYGGIVLNDYVGGLDPAVVEDALRLGARQIWMPTIDARNHIAVHGARGTYDVQKISDAFPEPEHRDPKGLSIHDPEGRLRTSVREILSLIACYGAILGTCHLGRQEIIDLVREARKAGIRNILVTHPYFKVPALCLGDLKTLTAMGATAEFGYCTVSPMWHYSTVQDVAHAIEEIGADRCIVMSDTGQRHNPMPHESLRVFAQCLHECGLTVDQIELLMIKNPSRLLGL